MQFYFRDFEQPNAVTWLCLSLLLAIAVFFRFSRFFSLRNWDLISLFLLAPGLLVINTIEKQMAGVTALPEAQRGPALESFDPAQLELLTQGYLWVLLVTGYFVVRGVVDLFLVRRPHLEPNLNSGGLVFLGVSLLAFLMYGVFAKAPDPSGRQAAHVATRAWKGEKPDPSAETPTRVASSIFTFPLAGISRQVSQRIHVEDPVQLSVLETGVARSVVIVCHLLILTALILIGWRHFDSPSSGIGMAALYLLLPMTALNVEKIDHLLPSVFLLWAVHSYRKPWLAGIFFGLAGEFFYPLFLLPLWIGFYWRRGARWFLASFVGVALALLLIVWWLEPVLTFLEVWTSSISWKAWDLQSAPATLGVWSSATQFYRLPILLVYGVGAIALAFWPKEKNLAELLALSVVLILGVQFWYADRGGSYIHWYLPLLLLMIFRPNLASARPPERAH